MLLVANRNGIRMAMPMIAERIYNGETAKQIGISLAQYESRKTTLARYLDETGGAFDPIGYTAWLATDAAGDIGKGSIQTVAGKPVNRSGGCPACGGGRIR